MSPEDNRRNTELLDHELPDPRFVDERYLHWLYDQNPDGPAIQAAADEGGVRVAHYTLVPQTYRNAAGEAPFLFSLNAVTRRGTQRKGYWSELGQQVFAEATAQGRKLVIGVPNEKSTPGAVKYLGYRFVGPMPVHVTVPTGRGRGFEHHPVDDAFLDGPAFAALAPDLSRHEAAHWTNHYTPERLRWRLARPHGDYVVHVGADLVGVSTRSALGPVPMAVLLKVFPAARPPSTGAARPGAWSPPSAPTTGRRRWSTPGSTPWCGSGASSPPTACGRPPSTWSSTPSATRCPRRRSGWIPSSSSTSTPTEPDRRSRPHGPPRHLHLRRRGPPAR